MYLQKIAATRLEITPQKKTKSNNREKGDREGDGCPLRLFYTGHFLNKKTAWLKWSSLAKTFSNIQLHCNMHLFLCWIDHALGHQLTIITIITIIIYSRPSDIKFLNTRNGFSNNLFWSLMQLQMEYQYWPEYTEYC